MAPLEEMSEFFNERAHSYDIVHTNTIDGGAESKNIIASFFPECCGSILDIGIGTGLELDKIFERFPGVNITGLDISQGMLDLLKTKYPDKHITLYKKSYLDFDFGENLYDAVISVMTLHHYTHEIKTELYHKIKKALRPGGAYIECDYMLSEHENENPQKLEDFYFSELERLKREQSITDNREYHYDTPCTVDNQKKMLLNAGFIEVNELWRVKNTVILRAC